MIVSADTLERGHERIGSMIDRVFPPSHEGEEVAFWDRHWAQRLASADQSGRFPEHHVLGKRWLYERVADAVEHCVGGPLKGKVVAEFGCGSGYATLCLAQRGAHSVLIDASDSALRYARRLAAHLDCEGRVSFLNADLLDEQPLGPFDVVFNSGVLEHYTPDIAVTMLSRMAQVARPGGTVITILPNLIAPVLISRMVKSRSKGTERFYTPWLLRRIFERAGIQSSRKGYVSAHLPVETPLWAMRLLNPLLSTCAPGILSALFYRWARLPTRDAP